MKDLILEEAYRVLGNELRDSEQISAFQAILRAQINLALKGHGPAQRAFIRAVVEADDEKSNAKESSKTEGDPNASGSPGRSLIGHAIERLRDEMRKQGLPISAGRSPATRY